MKGIVRLTLAVFIIIFLFCGCNIIPKSVQYQKEEEKIVGSTDTISPRVEEIQVVLNALGYDIGNTDGRMGQKTREAIREFQESRGLKSIGYIDTLTWREIEDIRRLQEDQELEKSYTIKVRSPYLKEEDAPRIQLGVAARDIQRALKKAGFDSGAIDGKMGPRTQQAVKEFQKTKGLVPDGKVGPKTWAELGKYLER
ncbi:peptidoglycan-binding protein [Candidatus Omnitrophota bacterium]